MRLHSMLEEAMRMFSGLVTALSIFAGSAQAHGPYEWIMVGERAQVYEAGCCGPYDCGVATSVSTTTSGYKQVEIETAQDGSVLRGLVTNATRQYASPDGRIHACIIESTQTVRCIFYPATADEEGVPEIVRQAFAKHNEH